MPSLLRATVALLGSVPVSRLLKSLPRCCLKHFMYLPLLYCVRFCISFFCCSCSSFDDFCLQPEMRLLSFNFFHCLAENWKLFSCTRSANPIASTTGACYSATWLRCSSTPCGAPLILQATTTTAVTMALPWSSFRTLLWLW